MNTLKKAWINGLFFIATLGVNTLGAMGLIYGFSQKQISDMYTTMITPSSSTFSIWSVIYLLLLTSLVVMIVKNRDPYYQNAINETSGLFRISCILNMAWIVAFSYLQIEISSLLIIGFAIVLAIICIRLGKIQEGNRFLLPLTFGLYTGWLFIATVVNIAVSLVKLKWDGFGLSQDTWASIILTLSVVLVFIVLEKISNAVFPLPVAWAYYGIYKYLNAPEGFKGEFILVQNIALGGMSLLIIIAAFKFYKNGFAILPRKLENNFR